MMDGKYIIVSHIHSYPKESLGPWTQPLDTNMKKHLMYLDALS